MKKPSIHKQLTAIFEPRAVSVIGASNNPDRWGYGTMGDILEHSQFRGNIYPIHPKDKMVRGVKAYKQIMVLHDYTLFSTAMQNKAVRNRKPACFCPESPLP